MSALRLLPAAAGLVAVLAASTPGTLASFVDTTSNSAITWRASADFLPVLSSAPDISGSPQQGQAITVNTASWTYTPDSYLYQWLACDASGAACAGATGAGATTATYTVAAADTSGTLRVDVRAVNGAVTSAAARSEQTDTPQGPIATQPVNTVMPTVSGTVAVGSTLTVTNGTWSGGGVSPTYPKQWRRCNATGQSCVDIAGAIATTYVVTAADSGSRLRVWAGARTSGLATPTSVLTADTAMVP